MLKSRARAFAAAVLMLDLSLVGVAFFVSYWIRGGLLPIVLPATSSLSRPLYPLEAYLPLLPLALLFWGAALYFGGRYRSARTLSLASELWGLVRASVLAAAMLILAVYLFRLEGSLGGDDLSRSWIGLFAVVASLFVWLERLAIRLFLRRLRLSGLNYRAILVIGTNELAAKIGRRIRSHPHWGLRLLGFVETGELHPETQPVFCRLPELLPAIDGKVLDEVVVTVPSDDRNELDELIFLLQEKGVRVHIALHSSPHPQTKPTLSDLDGTPLLTLSTTPTDELRLLIKRGIDFSLSLAMLTLGLPVILFVCVAIKLTSKGPILFRQTRVGLNGRHFTLLKFRTMVQDAEKRLSEIEHLNEMDGPVFKIKRDPRVTSIGRFLRRFSLDEIPQLVNVLRGDMSLVGPRPPIPEEVAQYENWQRRRLAVRPGLSGLWQVSGRNLIGFDEWMQLDLKYIDNWSLRLDAKILIKTFVAVLSGRGAS